MQPRGEQLNGRAIAFSRAFDKVNSVAYMSGRSCACIARLRPR